MNAHPERKLTHEQLRIDCRSIAEQVFSAWDGQVDVVIMLVPRTGLIAGEVSTGRTIDSNERYREVLKSELRAVTDANSIKNAGKIKV